MSDGINLDVCMSSEDAFCVILLATCQSTKNILMAKHNGNSKRFYYLERLERDIEGLNRTYPGFLDDSFQERAIKYHQTIEDAMNELLRSYKKED